MSCSRIPGGFGLDLLVLCRYLRSIPDNAPLVAAMDTRSMFPSLRDQTAAGQNQKRDLAALSRRQALRGLAGGVLATGTLLLPAAACGGATAAPVPSRLPASLPPAVRFDVLRGNDPIGSHQVDFQGSINDFSVRTRIDIAVRLLGVTVFVFRHDSTEHWREGRLHTFESKTTDDDSEFFVSGHATVDGFSVTHRKGTELAPADIMVASYWTPSIARQTQLIDPQRGRVKPQQLLGTDTLKVPVAGKPVETSRYEVTGVTEGWVAYDASGRWLAAMVRKKGTDIVYRLHE